MELSFLLNVLLGIVTLFYLFVRRRFRYWRNRNVPYIEPEFWYGNTRGITTKYNADELTRKLYMKLKSAGPIVGIFIYFRPQACIIDLDLVRQILVKDFNIFTNRGNYFNEEDDPLSAHLFAIEDDKWKKLRTKITPTFTSSKMKSMIATVAAIADTLVEVIQKETAVSGQLKLKKLMARYTTDVIGSTAFGIDCNSLEDKTTKFYEMGLKSFTHFNFLKEAFITTYPKLSRKLHITTGKKEIRQFYIDVVRNTINYRKENPELQRNDFVDSLMNLKGQDALTFNQIAAQCAVFFLAGFETSSTTLTCCMFELALNKDVQRKARETVTEVLMKHANNFTYEAMSEMTYLEQCVNETLRKYPPVSNLPRVAKEDYHIPNTNIIIEKGSSVIVPVAGIHYDPDIYPDPEKYDPDRFAPEEVKNRHPFAFLPFGEGPRICIGLRFAIIEVKIALAKILTNFEFTLDRTKTSVPMKFEHNRLFLTPCEDININFVKL